MTNDQALFWIYVMCLFTPPLGWILGLIIFFGDMWLESKFGKGDHLY